MPLPVWGWSSQTQFMRTFLPCRGLYLPLLLIWLEWSLLCSLPGGRRSTFPRYTWKLYCMTYGTGLNRHSRGCVCKFVFVLSVSVSSVTPNDSWRGNQGIIICRPEARVCIQVNLHMRRSPVLAHFGQQSLRTLTPPVRFPESLPWTRRQ